MQTTEFYPKFLKILYKMIDKYLSIKFQKEFLDPNSRQYSNTCNTYTLACMVRQYIV